MVKASGPHHRKAFRNNYLAAFGIAVFFLNAASVNAQIIPNPNKGNYGTRYNRVAIDSTLYFPTGCGIPTDTTFLFSQQNNGKGQKGEQAAIYYDSCGHHEYIWDPSLRLWHVADSASGGGTTDTANLSHRIDSVSEAIPHPFTTTTPGIVTPAGAFNSRIALKPDNTFGPVVTPADTSGKWVVKIYRSNDSVYYCKGNGAGGLSCTFAFFDSVGTGGGSDSGITAGIGVTVNRVSPTVRIVNADTALGHVVASQPLVQKKADSLGAIIGSKVGNYLGVSYLGYGSHAARPTSGTGLYWDTDSASLFFVNGASYSNLLPALNIFIQSQAPGAAGDTSYLKASGGNLLPAPMRDSTSANSIVHHIVNPDGSWTWYTTGSGYDSAASQNANLSGGFHTDSFNVRKYQKILWIKTGNQYTTTGGASDTVNLYKLNVNGRIDQDYTNNTAGATNQTAANITIRNNAATPGGTINGLRIVYLPNGSADTVSTANLATIDMSNTPVAGIGVGKGINVSLSPSNLWAAQQAYSTSYGAGGLNRIGYFSDIGVGTGNYAAYFTGSAASYFSSAIGIANLAPAASSLLDIVSTSKGVLLPRMTTTQMLAISSPASGLTIFNTDSVATGHPYAYWDGVGSVWRYVGSGFASAGGGSQTLPQVLATGRTLTKDSVLLSGQELYFKGGHIRTDTIRSNVPVSYSQKNFWFFGTSITFGAAAYSTGTTIDSTKRFANLVSAGAGQICNNRGLAGATVQKRSPIQANLIDQMTSFCPTKTSSDSLFFIEGSANDVILEASNPTTYNQANFITDLTSVVNIAIGKGWPAGNIYLMSSSYLSGFTRIVQDSLFNAVQTVATSLGCHVIDIYHTSLSNLAQWYNVDLIHPGLGGHSLIANKILNTITTPVVYRNQRFAMNDTAEVSHLKFSGQDTADAFFRPLGIGADNKVMAANRGYFITNAPPVQQDGFINMNGIITASQIVNGGMVQALGPRISDGLARVRPELYGDGTYSYLSSLSENPVAWKPLVINSGGSAAGGTGVGIGMNPNTLALLNVNGPIDAAGGLGSNGTLVGGHSGKWVHMLIAANIAQIIPFDYTAGSALAMAISPNAGTVMVGTATAAGSQLLQVNGGGFFNGSLGIGLNSPVALLHIKKTLTTAVDTTDGVFANVDSADVSHGGGSLTNRVGTSFKGFSISATAARTTTNAYTVYINHAPVAGTNETITNPWSFGVGTGKSFFGGALQIKDGTQSNGYVYTSDANGNGSWQAPGGGASAPFADNVALVKNNSDATKLAIFSAAGLTTATTRTYGLPDFNGIFAMTNHAQTWTGAQDMTTATLTVATQAAHDSTTKAADNLYVDRAVAQAIAALPSSSLSFAQTADQTVSNTTTQTTLIGTGVGSMTIPANSLVAGKTLHLKGFGVFSTAASAPTINFSIQGSTMGSLTVSPTLTGSISGGEVEWDILITIRTTGSSGTTGVGGYVSVNGVKTYYTTNALLINTTLSDTIDFTTQWGTANASNLIVSYFNKFTIE